MKPYICLCCGGVIRRTVWVPGGNPNMCSACDLIPGDAAEAASAPKSEADPEPEKVLPRDVVSIPDQASTTTLSGSDGSEREVA